MTRCRYCDEWIDPETDEQLAFEPFASAGMHSECLIRTARGSASEQLRSLAQNAEFGDEPSGLSKHEAARIAYDVFKLLVPARTQIARARTPGKSDHADT